MTLRGPTGGITMELDHFLKSIEFFSDLGAEDIALLAENSQSMDCPDDTKIIKIGDIGRFLWIVYEGEVDVSLPDETGKQQVIASLERGAFFGEMSILSGCLLYTSPSPRD